MVTPSRSRLSCLAGFLLVVGVPIGFCAWIVMIDQHDANGNSVELLNSSQPGRNARELDAVAARVTTNDLV